MALLADLVPPAQRVTLYAVYRLAINLGFTAGPATAGLLAERSFFLLLAGDAATSALFGLVALTLLPREHRAPPHSTTSGERVSLRAVLGDAPFVTFLVCSTAIGFVFFQFSACFPLHVASVGLSPSVHGGLISLNGLVAVLLEVPLTAWSVSQPSEPESPTTSPSIVRPVAASISHNESSRLRPSSDPARSHASSDRRMSPSIRRSSRGPADVFVGDLDDAEWLAAQVEIVNAQQIPEHNRSGDLLGKQLDA